MFGGVVLENCGALPDGPSEKQSGSVSVKGSR
jgi:hypothetical protein